ncbi:Methylthioribose-1-phosphate isomerase [Quillaja saponaria]|uniref:Methylthioribose-1-phosphate isomerase n=1 Tax=Quillaja saponaria TaxID=32244 RepID=A0AAD7QI85_QUISA|nr:Methylthioribose-1-phosphate isomerase [Quillaja saponaria]
MRASQSLPADLYDEQRLRNEVIFLHSLWHQGPPTNPNPIPVRTNSATLPFIPNHNQLNLHNPPWHTRNSNRRPTYIATQFLPRALQPINSTTFKNRKKKAKRNRGMNKGVKRLLQPDLPPCSSAEWPCMEPVQESDTSVSGWPTMKPCSTPATRQISAEDRERASALQMQYKASDAFRGFLLRRVGSDTDEDDDVEEDDEDNNDIDDDGSEESGEYEFLLNVFVENSELRTYYEKNYESGNFCCFVCGGIGKKNAGKKFKDCLGLVQHSIAITNTKKKWAHRAFGQVICKVLGWDIDRLPTIVLKGEPLGRTLSIQLRESEGSLKDDDTNNNTDNPDEGGLDVGAGKARRIDEGSCQSPVSFFEWPCQQSNDDFSSMASGWPAFNSQLAHPACSVSEEDQASIAAFQLQQKALEACKEFFDGHVDSDEDEDEDDNNNVDPDELIDDDVSIECEQFNLFLRMFTENGELRRYYESNYKGGDFYCLVCWGIGKKIWKRFKDCSGLLQHCTAILRTKRKRAHRAYGQVICKVLGWDTDRLPAIVLKGETFGQSSAKSVDLQDEPEKSAGDHIDGANVPSLL